jgi:hypothetical protein
MYDKQFTEPFLIYWQLQFNLQIFNFELFEQHMLSEISFSFELFFRISFDHDDTAQSTFLALILLTIINQKTREILPALHNHNGIWITTIFQLLSHF